MGILRKEINGLRKERLGLRIFRDVRKIKSDILREKERNNGARGIKKETLLRKELNEPRKYIKELDGKQRLNKRTKENHKETPKKKKFSKNKRLDVNISLRNEGKAIKSPREETIIK